MKIIKPTDITDARIVSTTIIDVAPAAYAGGATYALGATVSVVEGGATGTAGATGVRHVYESKQAGNTGHTPPAPQTEDAWWKWRNATYQAYSGAATYAQRERVQDNTTHLIYQSVIPSNTGQALTDDTKWLLVGATNSRAAFDDEIGTVTLGASPLVMVLDPGATSGIGFIEMVGRQLQVVGTDGAGGPTVYNQTVMLDGTIIESFFDWFFADYEQLRDLALTDLPSQFQNIRLTITITGTSGAVGAGVVKPGQLSEIGETQKGATVGNLGFTKKVRDENFGTVSIVKGGNAKLGNFEVLCPAYSLNRIYRFLNSIDGTLCFFIGSEMPGLEPTLSYGFYRDYSIAIEYDLYHLLSIQIEGVTNNAN